MYKPKDYNSLSPYFVVQDPTAFIAFLKAVFDAEELRKYAREDGSIMHAELKIDDSVVMLASATEQYPPIEQLVHVYVSDVDAVFERAKNAQCAILADPAQRPNDPDKRGSFKDIAGNFWSVATQMGE